MMSRKENIGRHGLLTDSERELLTNGEEENEERAEVIQHLSEQFQAVLEEAIHLYVYLPDEELESIFTGDELKVDEVMSAQYMLALLYHGLRMKDENLEYRLTVAIEQAESARRRDASVDLDIITQPFLPPEKRLEAIKQDEGRVSVESLEQIFYDERSSPEEVADALSELDDEITPEEIRKEREEMGAIERPPISVVTDVQVSEEQEGVK
jgi:hypothetical protein